MQVDFVFLSYYLLSFFFFMIFKCYSIAYKDSLQEYNVILLYRMIWIIWCLAYVYIFILTLLHLILFSISLPKKGDYSLSLSLSLSLSYLIIFATLL